MANKGARIQQTARAGEHFVAAELNRRGAYAVTFAGNMPKIDVMATNSRGSRTVRIQVKTRRSGSWHARTFHGERCKKNPNETEFWIFVDISKAQNPPGYYVVPAWWMRNDIHKADKAYEARRGKPKEHTHHGIKLERIEQWRDRWELLDIDLEEVI